METFRSLARGVLPPAGSVIKLAQGRPRLAAPVTFGEYQTTWVDSGTSALAAALITSKNSRQHIRSPEVIVPAYCCPDLVAAAYYAGVKVVVADISVNDPAYNLINLQAAITDNTLAVIAVNFLGIREQLSHLRALLNKHPHIYLIEDNAQWFPDESEPTNFAGDFVVFSFGRGKPVSLLGGGVLLSRLKHTQEMPFPATSNWKSKSAAQIKFSIYNLLFNPFLYQLLARNPLLKLGETRFHPLESISAMDNYRHQLLNINIAQYKENSGFTSALAARYTEMLQERSIANQLTPLNSARCSRLLRYPLLLDSPEARNCLLAKLNERGLGCTALYQKPLTEISGVTGIANRAQTPNASSFAERLITLPLHTKVGDVYCRLIEDCLKA